MVFTVVSFAPTVPLIPATCSAAPPAPFSPWQAWHFATYTASPCLAVPLPCGRPAPLGSTVISHDSISSGVVMRPRRGHSCAMAAPETTRTAAAAARRLRIDMVHLPLVIDRPAGDAIGHVITRQSALSDHRGAGPLHIAGVVGAAALQDGRPA